MRLVIIYCFLFFGFNVGVFAQNGGGIPFIKSAASVLSMPVRYQYPSQPLSMSKELSPVAWIVYTDRPEVVAYSDTKKTSETKRLDYLDSFYVLQASDDMFELIHYSKSIIESKNKITGGSIIDYVGWVETKFLLLNGSSFVQEQSKDALKYISILHGADLFSGLLNTVKKNAIPVYKDPSFEFPAESKNLKFQEIVYVYKEENNRYLLGTRSHIRPSGTSRTIIGWVDARFIHSWGSPLCVEANDVYTGDTTHTIVFPEKNHALHFTSHLNTGVQMKSTDCLLNETLWRRHPVFETESLLFNQQPYIIYHTGTVIRPFSFDQAFVYTVEGKKIPYAAFCALKEASSKTNIVFVMNMDDDVAAYHSELITTLQGLDDYFPHSSTGSFSFHIINSNIAGGDNILSRDSYSEILSALINLTKKSMQFKQTASSSGILNGLCSAARFLKNHVSETNVIILLSSRGDGAAGDAVYKSKTELLVKDLALCDAKVLFIQPYASNISTYASFVPQAKNIIAKYADRCIAAKNQYRVKTSDISYSTIFTSIEARGANLYCLDYPAHASTQGFILFPTIGSVIPTSSVITALDSLFMQSALEHRICITELDQAFNSSNVFESQTNKSFERYYNMYGSSPRNLGAACKNINFPYFSEGYLIAPNDPHTGIRYYSQYLLLSEWEYTSLCNLFKRLFITDYVKAPTEVNRDKMQTAFSLVLKEYAQRQHVYHSQSNLTHFFYLTCGYKSSSALFDKILINRIFDSHVLSTSSAHDLFTSLQKRITNFYALEKDQNHSFVSNGVRYYWVDESMLP